MVSGMYWSKGTREINEDSLALECVSSDRGKSVLMVVADGIGSMDYGEIASGYVVECFVKWFYRYGIRLSGKRKYMITRSLNKCAYDCSQAMKHQAEKLGINWGSTCALVCIWKGKYVALNIGDSVIVKIGRNKVSRLFDVDRNEKGMLVKALGSMRYQRPNVRFGRLYKGEAMMVATDGFVEKISVNEMGEALHVDGEITEDRVNRRLSRLGGETIRRGGGDNKSAIYVYRKGWL